MYFALEINFPDVVAVFIISIIVFIVSLLLTLAIKKIPKIGKYIV